MKRPPRARHGGLRVALELTRDFAGYPLRVHRESGRVVHLPIPGLSTYLVGEPALIEQVLVKDHKSYRKDYTTRLLSQFLGEGLLTSEGDFWRRQRRLAQPAFHHHRIEAYGAIMADETARELESWNDGDARDLRRDMMRLTMAIVSKALFGDDARSDARAVSDAIDVFMDRTLGIANSGINLPTAIPTPGNRRFLHALDTLDTVLFRMIEKRRAAAEETRGDLLSMLLSARDEDGERMSDRALRDECVTMFVAGHETTALTLTFALHLISHHPEVELRLFEEIDQVLAGALLTAADVSRLPYVGAVVKEAMRLYPPAYGIGREAVVDATLGPYDVPRGTQLLFWQYAVHRDPEWFPRPEAFEPERWQDGLSERLPRFAYFPFGGGPRVCIGNAFAQMEAVLVLAGILSRFRVSSLEPRELPLAPSVTLRPRGAVRARVARR